MRDRARARPPRRGPQCATVISDRLVGHFPRAIVRTSLCAICAMSALHREKHETKMTGLFKVKPRCADQAHRFPRWKEIGHRFTNRDQIAPVEDADRRYNP